jgi:hypothetical protein
MAVEVISQPGGTGTERTTSGPSQSEDRRKPNYEPTDDEKTVVADWLKRVQRAEDVTLAKEWRDSLEKLRRYERGAQTVDDKKSRTNMVYSTMAAQMPELYAKNPTIAVSPTDAVSTDQIAKVKKFCATGDKVIRKMMVEEGKLKKRAKANIRATLVTSFGVLKMVYQKEFRGDPITIRRIEDTQDNLARVEALIQALKKEEDPTRLATQRDELRANLKALSSGNEVKIFKGFVIDRVKSEDFLVLDDNIAEFDEYVDAAANGHKIWMPVGEARTLFVMEPHGATRYGRPRSDANQKVDDTPADDQFICVVEIWDKKNGVVRTTAKGMNRWLREPYAPRNTPQRWYPFYVLGFNLTESEWRPLSDVEMLMGLQDEYDRTRQNYADVREKAVPVLIFRKGGSLVEEDIKAVTDRKNKETIGVEGNPTIPLSQDLLWFKGAEIDPAAYDVSMIRNDMDLVSGRSDASRANLIKPKTATEAEIMQEAMQSRVGERRDTHEDLLSEMGEAALEITLRDLTKVEVQELAGGDAEWPETPQGADDVFRMVSVRVRAGSSGKPNMQKEREQWGQLMPVIEKTMVGVSEMRAQGNYDMAEAALELLRETLRRFDEHLDLDSIIPPMAKDENGKPVAQAQAAAELVKCKEELAACQEQVQKQAEEITKLKAGEASKIAQADSEKTVGAAKAAADASFNRWKAILDAAVKVQQAEIQAAATAHADDKTKRDQAMKEAASEGRLAQIITKLEKTLDKLGSAIETVGK